MVISLSTKNMRDSNIFSWIRTVPSDWVATTVMMLTRSAGNPGQGASSILGMLPPRSGTIVRFWSAGTRIVRAVRLPADAQLAEADAVMRRCSGPASSISISPRVTAARPMSDPTSM